MKTSWTRMAAEEQKYHEDQAKKWEELNQISTEFKVVKHGFATNEPHPNDDVLWWLQWNDDSTQVLPKVGDRAAVCMSLWLQRTCQENVLGLAVAKSRLINWESSIFPAHQHQTT